MQGLFFFIILHHLNMMINKGSLICLMVLFFFSGLYPAKAAPDNSINNFIIKENLIGNGKLAIIACDSAEKPLESVNGIFRFVINGFQHELRFHDGVAITPQTLEKSTFVFLKHRNESGSHGKLYFVAKNKNGLNPIQISWIWLIAIPVVIILLMYLFKRFVVAGILILAGLFYFNYSKGLDIENLFETIFHGIKGVL